MSTAAHTETHATPMNSAQLPVNAAYVFNRCLPSVFGNDIVPGTPMLISNVLQVEREAIEKAIHRCDNSGRFILATAFDSMHTELPDRLALIDTRPELDRESLWRAMEHFGV